MYHSKTKILAGLVATLSFLAAPAFAQPCPAGVPPGTTCVDGKDANGAFFLIAIPPNGNHQLVLWNHGYTLDPPKKLSASDLGPGLALLQLGFSVAASSYRPDAAGLGGYAVRDGPEDTENLRQRYVQLFGRPLKTFVIGASEGGIITAAMAERFGLAADGSLNYDGVVPLCGPLAGGRRNFYGAFSLRVVYQYYCSNLPRPNEDPYPLYFGLAANNTLSLNEVVARINECTGVAQPPATRTGLQKQNLTNILNVIKIPESFLITDMGYATFGLQELTLVRTGGLSPVTNWDVFYQGSTDDLALNAGVFRAGVSSAADQFMQEAYDPNGDIAMPVLTLHTIGDGLVVVENENAYRQIIEDKGNGNLLQQNYVNANGHCEFTNSEVLAAFQGLIGWVATHQRPTRQQIANLCEANRPLFHDTCHLNLTFEPNEFNSRALDPNVDPQP